MPEQQKDSPIEKVLQLLGKRAVATTAGVVGAGAYFAFASEAITQIAAVEGVDPNVAIMIEGLIFLAALGGYLFFLSGRNPDGKPADYPFDQRTQKSVVTQTKTEV